MNRRFFLVAVAAVGTLAVSVFAAKTYSNRQEEQEIVDRNSWVSKDGWILKRGDF